MVRAFQAETHMSEDAEVWGGKGVASWLSWIKRVAELGLERKQRAGLRGSHVPWRDLELCSVDVLSHP